MYWQGFIQRGGAPWDLPPTPQQEFPPAPRILKVMVSKRAVVLNASDGTHGSSQLSCQKPTRLDLRAVIFQKFLGCMPPDPPGRVCFAHHLFHMSCSKKLPPPQQKILYETLIGKCICPDLCVCVFVIQCSGKLEYVCGVQTEGDPVDVQFRYISVQHFVTPSCLYTVGLVLIALQHFLYIAYCVRIRTGFECVTAFSCALHFNYCVHIRFAHACI